MEGRPATVESSLAQGRAVFDVQCAPCHGVDGSGGGYLTASTRSPDIAGARFADVMRLVRQGGKEMPAFSGATLSDASLRELATYIHESLGHPPGEPALMGPRTLSPFSIGVIAWSALALFVFVMAIVFSEGRS